MVSELRLTNGYALLKTINKYMDKLKYDKCEGFHKMVIFVFALLTIPFIWDDAKKTVEMLIEILK